MVLGTVALLMFTNTVHGQTVTVAGFAYGGEFASASQRFPLAASAIDKYKFEDQSGTHALSRKVVQLAQNVKADRITVNTTQLASLKSSDQALVAALVLTNETTLVEQFTQYSKIFVSLHAEALLFDFKSQTVLRSYPINVVIFDAKPTRPSPGDLEALVGQLIFADDGKSLVYQFSKKLEQLSIPLPGTKTVQVRKSDISAEPLTAFPKPLQSSGVAQTILLDTFSTALSSRTGVPIIPSRISHSTGVMKVRFEDTYQYELKIPDGDYVFDIELKRFAKLQHSKNNVGSAYIYGAFVGIHFQEPMLNTTYFNAELKNGEVAVVPAGRETADDFPAYQDAVRGLFTKLSDAIQKQDLNWIRTASNAPDIQTQLKLTREILEGCKK